MITNTESASGIGSRAAQGASPVRAYDPKIFGGVLRDMKGTKSYRELAIETDLSESFISKAANGLLEKRPSKRTVMKLMRARTDDLIDRRELVRAAGYDERELETELDADKADKQPLSAAAVITRYYGEDSYTAMSELQKALSGHVLKGDVASYYHHEAGYFEVTDVVSGQVYAGINAYVKPIKHKGDETLSKEEIENIAVFSIGLSVGLTFNRIVESRDAKDKIIYVLTDNEKVYEACRNTLEADKTKATVVVITDDHQGFRDEAVLEGSEERPVSLVD